MSSVLLVQSDESGRPRYGLRLGQAEFVRRIAGLATEVLDLFDAEGRMVETPIEGTRDQVPIPTAWDRRDWKGLALVHNHPDGSTLSPADIDALLKRPGAKVVAVLPSGDSISAVVARPEEAEMFDLDDLRAIFAECTETANGSILNAPSASPEENLRKYDRELGWL